MAESEPNEQASGTPADRSTEELRAEVEALRAQLGKPAKPVGSRLGSMWRGIVVTILLVVMVILSPLSVVSAWAAREVGSTDRYVQTVAPLAEDPAIQAAITDRVTQEILDVINVPQITDDTIAALTARGLRPRVVAALEALSGPLASGIESFIHDRVEALIESDAFADAWVAANRQAHEELVVLLTGETSSETVDVSGTTVSVNLAGIINAVKEQLVAQGFQLAERIPTVNATFVLFESADLAKAQSGFRLLRHLAIALPIIVLGLFAIVVFIARNKRRAVIAGALSIAVGMLLLGLLLAVFRPIYLNAIPTDQVPSNAAAAVYDTLVGFIRAGLRGVLLIALIVALAAWVTGPSASAQGVRTGFNNVREARGRGFGTGSFGQELWTYRVVGRVTIWSVAAIVLLSKLPITGALVLGVFLVAGVLWLALELLASPPESADQSEPAPVEQPT